MNYSSADNYSSEYKEAEYGNAANTTMEAVDSNVTGYDQQVDNGYNQTPYMAEQQQLQQSMTDARSIYVGQVDYSTTPEELQSFFQHCGAINRVTILCDKFTGHPKGYGFIEFSDESAIPQALVLDQAEFRGRQLKVTPKRTNVPGLAHRGRGRGRGRGGRGGRYNGGRGGYGQMNPYFAGDTSAMAPPYGYNAGGY